jgi:hypothetical protein
MDNLPARSGNVALSPLEMIAAVARDPSIPIERIVAVIGLLEAREAEKQFNADFAAAMMEMPRVAKRGKKDMGAKGCIAYEKYEDLDAAIRPIEAKYGFARSFASSPTEKAGVLLTLRLTHRAGHSITSQRFSAPDPGPGRNGVQETGSAESYLRRYLTKSIWNIVTVGADDDGNSADPISDEQALALRGMLDYLAPTPKWYAQFWAWVGGGTTTVEGIQRKDYQRVHANLVRRVKAQEAQRGAK